MDASFTSFSDASLTEIGCSAAFQFQLLLIIRNSSLGSLSPTTFPSTFYSGGLLTPFV